MTSLNLYENVVKVEIVIELTGCRVHGDLNQVFSEYFLLQNGLTVLAGSVQLYVLMYM